MIFGFSKVVWLGLSTGLSSFRRSVATDAIIHKIPLNANVINETTKKSTKLTKIEIKVVKAKLVALETMFVTAESLPKSPISITQYGNL